VNQDNGPLLRVIRGNPTDEELAALTVVVSAKLATRHQAAAQHGSGAAARRGWPDRAALLRAPLITGLDAWRHSARPR
jgi:hypothetical protein